MAEKLTAIEALMQEMAYQAPEVPVTIVNRLAAHYKVTVPLSEIGVYAAAVAFVRELNDRQGDLSTSPPFPDMDDQLFDLAARIEAASTDAGGRGEA